MGMDSTEKNSSKPKYAAFTYFQKVVQSNKGHIDFWKKNNDQTCRVETVTGQWFVRESRVAFPPAEYLLQIEKLLQVPLSGKIGILLKHLSSGLGLYPDWRTPFSRHQSELTLIFCRLVSTYQIQFCVSNFQVIYLCGIFYV